MVVYSVVFIILYAIAAYFCGNDLAFWLLVEHRDPYYTEIAYLIVINLVAISFHYTMQSYGKRKGFMNAPLIIFLCVIDSLFFGLNFLGLTIFLLSGGLGDFVERILTNIFRLKLPILCYCLLAYYVFHRIYVTVCYFRELHHSKAGT